MTDSLLDTTAGSLATGDRLLRLGGIGFAQFHDPDAAPVLVAEVRPPLDEVDPTEAAVEILTSAGTLYARDTAPALAARDSTVNAGTILLISRRQSLHARLTEFGVPVVRRTPLDPSKTAAAVTRAEWNTAPLIVIDGYLAGQTLIGMWMRGDLADRDQIVMVGTDPDDARVYARQSAARARHLAILPYDAAGLTALFQAAVNIGDPADAYFGILTPNPK